MGFSWPLIFYQRIPIVECLQYIETIRLLRWRQANDVVVVPKAEDQSEDNKKSDDRELPNATQINKKTAKGDP